MDQEIKDAAQMAKFADEEYEKSFLPSAHKIGMSTLLLAIPISLVPAAYLSWVKGYFPGWGAIATGFLMVAAYIGVIWFQNPITFFPILGTAGTYLAMLSGNIFNQKLPAAKASQASVNAEPGSHKAEMAGIFGLGVSVIINILCLVLLVVAGTTIVGNLSPAAKASFKYILPGVYGAMWAQYGMDAPVYAAIALPVGIAVNFIPMASYLKIPIAVAWAIIGGLQYYKRRGKNAA